MLTDFYIGILVNWLLSSFQQVELKTLFEVICSIVSLSIESKDNFSEDLESKLSHFLKFFLDHPEFPSSFPLLSVILKNISFQGEDMQAASSLFETNALHGYRPSLEHWLSYIKVFLFNLIKNQLNDGTFFNIIFSQNSSKMIVLKNSRSVLNSSFCSWNKKYTFL
jgi:hypothetical protein